VVDLSEPVPLAARAVLRQQLRRRRAAQSPSERDRAHRQVALHLAKSGWLRPGLRVALYAPVGSELETGPLRELLKRHGCIAYLPRITSHRLSQMTFTRLSPHQQRNRYGIFEPTGVTRQLAWNLDLILLPVIGFDSQGHRLGSGAGYYDRALRFRQRRQHWRGPKLVGLAYECQRVAALAARPTDIPLDAVITERGIEFFFGETT